MQTRVVGVLVAVLAYAMTALVCGAQETKRDIPGWSDTQWGMGLAALQKLHPEMTIGKGRFDLTAGVIPLEIGGQQFHAYLGFENVGGQRKRDDISPEPPQSEWKLAEVELWLETDDRKALGVCEDVANSLRGKYGGPTKSFRGGEVLWWVMPSTTIIKVAGEGVPGTKFKPSCSIRYFPTQISGSDKL